MADQEELERFDEAIGTDSRGNVDAAIRLLFANQAGAVRVSSGWVEALTTVALDRAFLMVLAETALPAPGDEQVDVTAGLMGASAAAEARLDQLVACAWTSGNRAEDHYVSAVGQARLWQLLARVFGDLERLARTRLAQLEGAVQPRPEDDL